MTTLYLGNHQPVESRRNADDTTVRVPLDGKRCTRVEFPAGTATAEAIATLTAPTGVWAAHSDSPNPAWLACTDPGLAAAMAAIWGCEVREPDPEVT
jgi:hypothetical protein